jgi:hypothetical protein
LLLADLFEVEPDRVAMAVLQKRTKWDEKGWPGLRLTNVG